LSRASYAALKALLQKNRDFSDAQQISADHSAGVNVMPFFVSRDEAPVSFLCDAEAGGLHVEYSAQVAPVAEHCAFDRSFQLLDFLPPFGLARVSGGTFSSQAFSRFPSDGLVEFLAALLPVLAESGSFDSREVRAHSV